MGLMTGEGSPMSKFSPTPRHGLYSAGADIRCKKQNKTKQLKAEGHLLTLKCRRNIDENGLSASTSSVLFNICH